MSMLLLLDQLYPYLSTSPKETFSTFVEHFEASYAQLQYLRIQFLNLFEVLIDLRLFLC